MKYIFNIISLLWFNALFSQNSNAVIEQRFFAVMVHSFEVPTITQQRSDLFWSYCLGETSALDKRKLAKMFAKLAQDSILRKEFYKRLNYYNSEGTVNEVLAGNSQFNYDKKMEGLVPQLSFDKLDITKAEWAGFCKHVKTFGDDEKLGENFSSCNNADPPVKVETKARYPGGDSLLMRFFARELVYPRMEREQDIEGKVIVKFMVCSDGNLCCARLENRISPGLDAQAMSLVKMLPKFEPAKKDGKPVNSWYSLPIVFKLKYH